MAIRTDDQTPNRLINNSFRTTFRDAELIEEAAARKNLARTDWMRTVCLTRAAQEMGVAVPDLERYNPRSALRKRADALGLDPRRLEEIGMALVLGEVDAGRITAQQLAADSDGPTLFARLFREAHPHAPQQPAPQQRATKRRKR